MRIRDLPSLTLYLHIHDIDIYVQSLQMNFMKDILKGGLNVHLLENPLLQSIFTDVFSSGTVVARSKADRGAMSVRERVDDRSSSKNSRSRDRDAKRAFMASDS